MRSLLDKLGIQHKGSWLHIFNVSRPSEATAGGIHLPSTDRPVDGPSHPQAIDWALTFSRPSRDTRLPSAWQGAWVGVVGWLWAPLPFAHRVGATSDSKGVGRDMRQWECDGKEGRTWPAAAGDGVLRGAQSWFRSGAQGTGRVEETGVKGEIHGPGF